MSEERQVMEAETRKIKRRQNIAFALALIGLAVYLVGGLNDWQWYALAAPYLLTASATGWLLFREPRAIASASSRLLAGVERKPNDEED
jgi:hypothetical protein